MPMLHSSSGLYFLSPDGIIDAYQASNASALSGDDATPVTDQLGIGDEAVTETGKPEKEEAEEEEKEPTEVASEDETDKAVKEIKAFLKWIRKGNMKRKFNFEAVDEDYAEVLNKYAGIGDLDSARWYAERYLGL
jgi:putative heme degradation protein